MAIENYSTTAADNTSLNGETVSDATLGSKLDNLFREMMADLATYFPSGILAVLRGGTGASTAAGARANLGLEVGTDVQAHNANLDTLAGITPGATGQALLADATPAEARTELGLGTAATQNVGTGANNVVQLNGSGQLPPVDGSQLTGVGGSVVLSDTTMSGGSTLSFTQFNSSLYSRYEIEFQGVVLSAATNVAIRTSTNGGSSYDSGASDYSEVSEARVVSGVNAIGDPTANDIRIFPENGANGLPFNVVIRIMSPELNTRTQLYVSGSYTRDDGEEYGALFGGGQRNANQVVNAVQVRCLSGNFSSGRVIMRGYP